ncbi:MAG: DUF4412 domain-containing protein [Nitrospirota bacterium]|nr:DUF4412 domain-containing protein [Nitrospirota bacterium]
MIKKEISRGFLCHPPRRPFIFPLFLLAVTVLMLPGMGAASAEEDTGYPEWQEPEQYSCEMVMSDRGQTTEKKVLRQFVDHDKTRIEIATNGELMEVIERRDLRVTYVMHKAEKVYFVMKIEEEDEGPAEAAAQRRKLRQVGTETIDGQECDKYELDSGQGLAYVWEDHKTKAPVRMEDDGLRIDWRNYHVGLQEAGLFEPPAGYKRVEMPDMSSMMNMMGGTGMPDMGSMMGMMGGAGMMKSMAVNAASGIAVGAAGKLGASIGMAAGGPLGSVVGDYVGRTVANWLFNKASDNIMPRTGGMPVGMQVPMPQGEQ